MKSVHTHLPWNGTPVRAIEGLNALFNSEIGDQAGRYLPAAITLFYDPEIREPVVWDFLGKSARYLSYELQRRAARTGTLCSGCFMSETELEALLTSRRDVQPWALYYSVDGGLGPMKREGSDVQGVVPCSSMQNHGVAWENYQGEVRIWLATARKPGQDWDWDSDLGHESAHAAFAPVPLFVQPGSDGPIPLSRVSSARELEPGHIARICYLFSELAVVAVRGEIRPTETSLPIEERAEMFALLALCEELIPGHGFDRALHSALRVNGAVDLGSPESLDIIRPILGVLPKLTCFTRSFTPPDRPEFCWAVQGGAGPPACAS